MTRRHRLLVVAPNCDATDVGEAWVAHQWVTRLAGRCDVTLLTSHKPGRTLPSDQLDGVEVVEWAEPDFPPALERFASMAKPAYPVFYRRVRRWVRAALRDGRLFDIAHQPTPVSYRYPSPLAGLGIPWVLGPVGGSLPTLPGFAAEETAPWYVRVRALDGLRLHLDPVLRASLLDADRVLGITAEVAAALSPVGMSAIGLMSETGLTVLPEPVPHQVDVGGVVRLLFVGRVVRTKGVRDLVRAMSHLRDLAVRLDVVGDGFDRAACEALAAELGVDLVVQFHGQQPRRALHEFYSRADLFVFPSYREAGGNVTYEALGHGLPCIVSDRGGPAAVVDETCALLVHPIDPEQYAQALATAVRSLASDPARRQKMGRAARRRVLGTGLWDGKVDQMLTIYDQVIEETRDRAQESRARGA